MDNSTENSKRFGGGLKPRVGAGIILIIAGILLLAYKMGAPLPSWLFTWPVILLLVGLFLSVKSRFTNPGGYILLFIGSFFLLDRVYPGLNTSNYILPVVLIGLGLIYLFRPKNECGNRKARWMKNNEWANPVNEESSAEVGLPLAASANQNNPEFIEVNAVFGGVKKIILSKNFRGGEITSFMGGTELNLLKADIQEQIVLDVTNIFGGTKLLVPSNWDVKNEVTAVFGGIEDKRSMNNIMPDPGKILVLKGTCVFGGIEVSNY